MEEQARYAEVDQLRKRLARLEEELDRPGRVEPPWPPTEYYGAYNLMAGMVLGLVASAASLLFNIVGAAMLNKHPLELIRVYLTFPLGEKALTLDSGFTLAAGCCLYLCTGTIGGIPFHMVLTRYFSGSSTMVRFLASSVLGVGVWIINYYGLLYWLQPVLIGGRWIVDQIPTFVAVTTHLVFGWTIFLMSHWARFTPPSGQARQRETSR